MKGVFKSALLVINTLCLAVTLFACSMPLTHTITIINLSESVTLAVRAGEVVIESGDLVDPNTTVTIEFEAEDGFFAMLYINEEFVDAVSPYTYTVDSDVSIEVRAVESDADAVRIAERSEFDLEPIDEEGFEGAYEFRAGVIENPTEFRYAFDRPIGQSGKILFVFEAQPSEDIYLIAHDESAGSYIWNVLGNREANPLLNETDYIGYWGSKTGNIVTAATEQNTTAEGSRQFQFIATKAGQYKVTMSVIDLNNQNAVLSSYSVLFIVQDA